MPSNNNIPVKQTVYEICSEEYDYAVNKCNDIYNKLSNVVSKLSYENKIIRVKNPYHFKYLHQDTNNGIHICIPPYNNNIIELYYIINNVRDNNNSVIINSDNEINDIIYHIKKCMFNNETQEYEIKNRYEEFSSYFRTITNRFNIKINKYNFNIIDKYTNNGYNLSINLNSNNYIYIRVIQNNSFYNNKNYTFYANSYENAINYLKESILNNKHNNKIKCYKIINTQFLSDNNDNIYNTISNQLLRNEIDSNNYINTDPE